MVHVEQLVVCVSPNLVANVSIKLYFAKLVHLFRPICGLTNWTDNPSIVSSAGGNGRTCPPDFKGLF